jgi:lysophospholipid acyltransferase (LPLAT)-like uncharacterized protein
MSGAPIIPVVPSAKRKFTAKSWDKYQVPYLFSPVITMLGDPIYIPKDINDEQKDAYRKQLEEELFRLRDAAEKV